MDRRWHNTSGIDARRRAVDRRQETNLYSASTRVRDHGCRRIDTLQDPSYSFDVWALLSWVPQALRSIHEPELKGPFYERGPKIITSLPMSWYQFSSTYLVNCGVGLHALDKPARQKFVAWRSRCMLITVRLSHRVLVCMASWHSYKLYFYFFRDRHLRMSNYFYIMLWTPQCPPQQKSLIWNVIGVASTAGISWNGHFTIVNCILWDSPWIMPKWPKMAFISCKSR